MFLEILLSKMLAPSSIIGSKKPRRNPGLFFSGSSFNSLPDFIAPSLFHGMVLFLIFYIHILKEEGNLAANKKRDSGYPQSLSNGSCSFSINPS